MSHGRKINKIETTLNFKRLTLPFIAVTDSFSVEDKLIFEDHRLIKWKRWLEIHQKQYQGFNKGESQHVMKAVVNSCEATRSQIEMRNLIKYITILISSGPDKYQVNPGLWKVSSFLPIHGNSCSSEVRPVLTKKELNLLPKLEYIDFSTCVKEEKNLLNPLQKVPTWKHSSYLVMRKQELADTIATLESSAPEAANLIARGQRFGHKEENMAHNPMISIMDTFLRGEDSKVNIPESLLDSSVVVTLRINDLEITRDEQSICDSPRSEPEENTWMLHYSNKVNQKSEQCLHFENTGTVAITYQWRNTSFTSEISPLYTKTDANFFFNKNKALILPGQKVEFPVWFEKHQSGMFSESWRMETDPIVSRAAIIIRMLGYVACEDSYTNEVEVDMYLDRCIRNTTVQKTIYEMIHTGRITRPLKLAYKNLYLEGKLFRARNPSHFYHASIVAKLHRLYVTHSTHDVLPWTFSLIDLRNILLQIENPNLRHERLKVFSDLCQQCLGPCLFNAVRDTMYGVVYNVLCSFANKMEEESDFVKRNCILRGGDSAKSIKSEIRIVQKGRPSNVLNNWIIMTKDSMTPTPKNEYRPKTLTSSRNSSLTMSDVKLLRTTLDRNEIVYREVFYVRVYKLLVEAVEQAWAVIDSRNQLNELEP